MNRLRSIKKNPHTPHIRKVKESPFYSCDGICGTTHIQAYKAWEEWFFREGYTYALAS